MGLNVIETNMGNAFDLQSPLTCYA